MTPEIHRPVTLKDVAKAAGVHVSTASRALDPTKSQRIGSQTVARVQLAAEQLGYMPDMIAKGLKRGISTMLGVIVANLESPFIGQIIRGISTEAEKRDYVTLIAETRESHERLERTLNDLLSRRVNAVITTAGRLSDRHLFTRYAERVPAFVLAVRDVPGTNLPCVRHDDEGGSELAAQHLLGLGHRVFAQLRGPQDVHPFRTRAEEFRRAIGASGSIDVTVAESASELTVEEGRRLMALTLDQNSANPPTAVFAHADMMAIGAIEELRARGLECPADVSVLGYGDSPLLDYLAPPLTTISLSGEDIGRRAGEMVSALIDNPDGRPAPVALPASLVSRASTAPPRG